MPILRSKLKKLWGIENIWVLLHVVITIFYNFCSVTFMSYVIIMLNNSIFKNSYSVECLSTIWSFCGATSSHQYNDYWWLKNWNQKCAILWSSQISKILIQLRSVVSNQIFLSFVACAHYNFLWFVFSYIHVICTCLFMWMSI